MKLILINSYLPFLKKQKIITLLSIFSYLVSIFFETFAIISLSSLILDQDLKLMNFYISKSDNIFYFFSAALISSFLHFFSEKCIIKIQLLTEKYLRINTTNALIKTEWIDFMIINQGDIAKSMSIESLRISEGLASFLRAFNSLLSSIIFFVAAIIINKTTALILIIYLIFVLPIYYLYSQKAKKRSKNISFQSEVISSISNKIFNNLKFLKSIGIESYFKRLSFEAINKYKDVYENSILTIIKSRLFFEIVAACFVFTVLIFRSESILLISSIGLFIRITPRVSLTQSMLIQSLTNLSYLKSYRERLSKCQYYSEEKNNNFSKKIDFRNLKIHFKDVYFSYPKNKEMILEKCNLEINKNEFVAIVGESGAGKSTITDLMTGLIKPNKGKIEIASFNIQNIDKDYWRKNLSIVMQDSCMIDDTLANNICLGSENFDEDKIIDSLKTAAAWDFVKNFRNGIYESMYEYGNRLSVGQKQRISIARALYRDPKFLILDEPTSSLDSYSENKFKDTINKLKGKLTIVVITHRMNIIDGFDKVYELKDKKLTLKK